MTEKWIILNNSNKGNNNLFLNKLSRNIGLTYLNITKDINEDYLMFVVGMVKTLKINVKDWKRKSNYMRRDCYGDIIPNPIPIIIGNFYNSIMFIHKEDSYDLEGLDTIYRELIQKNPYSQGLIFNIDKIENCFNTLTLEGLTIIENQGNIVEEQYFQFKELKGVKERFPNMVDQIIYIDCKCKLYNNESRLEFFSILKDRKKEEIYEKEIEMLKKQMSTLCEKHRMDTNYNF